ncbi:MAG: DUF4380 domain-containing protein [Verrucomicrobiota bacterium]
MQGTNKRLAGSVTWRSMVLPALCLLCLAQSACPETSAAQGASVVAASTYRGWTTLRLANGLVGLQILPDIGGRVIQFSLGRKDFLWVNGELVGKMPLANGLTADGGWFNCGGDKLWPAPQGWDNDEQWPGPPDAVLDGQPYALEQLPAKTGEVALQLTSRKDPRSGIQFSRVIRIFDGSTRVSFDATMKNVDAKPRRWGIWAHTQLNGARADGSAYNPQMQAWCPINPKSRFPQGYSVIFGGPDNPTFQPDAKRGLMRVQYQYKVGKIGMDSDRGWVATVDGESGAVFVHRFQFEPGKDYPDGSSVEFWLNGAGNIHAYNKEMAMPANPDENPYVFESEVLSPFARLEPGGTYTWHYDWYACNISGDFPVVDCTEAGLVAEPLRVETTGRQLRLKGRFGVFVSGYLHAEFRDGQGKTIRKVDFGQTVSPTEALVLGKTVQAPPQAKWIKLFLADKKGKRLGELAEAALPVDLK